ncbi:MAG TPA: hypothetical protein VHE34_21625 [Puia sp.]|uniref:hypothetical protein n=1 Tax=Puia sp. TaxID=2045100 RepID=UPI002C54B9DB|nr:hypothetical protein [Puia sp.]HVU97845.1 hypothetical protein [Puia sp.]
MKPSNQAWLRRLLGVSAAIVALAFAGYGHHSAVIYPHLSYFHGSGETVYIDSMDARVAMDCEPPEPARYGNPAPRGAAQGNSTNANRTATSGSSLRPHLSCFLMSWSDNIKYDDEIGMVRREKYIQFGIRRDWVALAGGDSIYANFFRQRPLLERHLHQWALVYPVPAGRRIDTLVYTGSETAWGKRLFILKRG